MASFKVQWRASINKDLRKLPTKEVKRALAEIKALEDEPFPHGAEKLSGTEHTYRIRLGDYRIVYEVLIDSKVVEVKRVRHRKDVYRK